MPVWGDNNEFGFSAASQAGGRGVRTIDVGIIDALFTADGVYSIYSDSLSSPYNGRVNNVDNWSPPCQAGGLWHRNQSSVLTMGMTDIAGKTAPQLWSNYLNAHMVLFSTTASMANSHSHGLTAYGVIPAGLGDGLGSYQADGSHPYYQEIGGANITLLTLSPGHLLEGVGVWVVDYDLGVGTPVDSVLVGFASGVHKNAAANTYDSIGFNAGSIGAQQTTYAPTKAFNAWGGWQYGLDLYSATINTCGIRMSKTTAQGTIIEYDSNDYSFYDTSGNVFTWRIGGADVLTVGAALVTMAAVKITGGASAGYVLTSDADGEASWASVSASYNVVDDTTPQLGGNLDLNGKNVTNTTNISGNYILEFTGGAAAGYYNVILASGGVDGYGKLTAQYKADSSKQVNLLHNGTDGGVSTAAGNIFLVPNGGTVAITGGLTTTTTVAATGNVTGANLAITNWNTAYGWGNHASAGYLTNTTINGSLSGDVSMNGSEFIGTHDGVYNTVIAKGQDASHAGALAAFYGTALSRGIGLYHDNTDAHITSSYGGIHLEPTTAGAVYVDGDKKVACGGGSTGAGTTPNGTVTLVINGSTYYLLKSASA